MQDDKPTGISVRLYTVSEDKAEFRKTQVDDTATLAEHAELWNWYIMPAIEAWRVARK